MCFSLFTDIWVVATGTGATLPEAVNASHDATAAAKVRITCSPIGKVKGCSILPAPASACSTAGGLVPLQTYPVTLPVIPVSQQESVFVRTVHADQRCTLTSAHIDGFVVLD